MNFYLIEPYNAYQKPPKKKHWTEILEEEQMYYHMIEEARKVEDARLLAEKAAHKTINQNLALPQYTPQASSQQTVQATVAGSAAGGGGWTTDEGYEAEEMADFTLVPSSGPGWLTVAFINNTRSPGNDTFLWNFGSGSATSTNASPTDVIYTQTGSYTVRLDATSSIGHMTTISKTVTVTLPVLTITSVNQSVTSAVAPYSTSFTDSTYYNGTGTLSGLWVWGDGKANTSFTASVTKIHVFESSSLYTTGSLRLTESLYNITASKIFYFSGSVPTISATLTVITSSNVAPITASYTASVTYNGSDAPTGTVYDTSGGTLVFTTSPMMFNNIEGTGSFTASINVTGSYNVATRAVATPWNASVPSLVASLTVTTSSNKVPMTASYTASYTYNGYGTVSGKVYDLPAGDREFTTTPMKFQTNISAGSKFTASLSLTESTYKITSIAYATPWSASV